jgi:hypothetical protein
VIALDADAAHERAERNRANQHVSLHPDVDGVAVLQVRGPAEQLVAAHRELTTWARGLRATGDERSMGQIMCATLVDELISRAHRTFYRRLITDPTDHTLIGRDPRRRRFDGPLNGFVRARDRHRCRQPGCDCRIGDIDHITDYAHGGPTTSTNGQGLCKRSHTFKHLPGWKVTTRGRDTIWRTPTGHTYTSTTPTVLTPRRQ